MNISDIRKLIYKIKKQCQVMHKIGQVCLARYAAMVRGVRCWLFSMLMAAPHSTAMSNMSKGTRQIKVKTPIFAITFHNILLKLFVFVILCM